MINMFSNPSVKYFILNKFSLVSCSKRSSVFWMDGLISEKMANKIVATQHTGGEGKGGLLTGRTESAVWRQEGVVGTNIRLVKGPPPW